MTRTVTLLALTFAFACSTTQSDVRPDRPEARAKGTKHVLGPKGLGAGINNALGALRKAELVTVLEGNDPIVSIRAVFSAGSVDDPVGKEGLTKLTAELMTEATKKLTSSEMSAAMFPWAAELSVQVDKERVVFMGRVHRDHAEKYLPIFFDVLADPRLDQADFSRLLAKQTNALEKGLRGESDEDLQRELLEVELFRGTRAGHTPLGTLSGLKAITHEDVVKHARGVFNQNRLLLGVSAGVPEPKRAKFRAGLLSNIARLPKSGVASVTPKAPAKIEKSRAVLVEKAAAGTAISVGYPLAVGRAHKDYAALKIAETFFGEHRNRVGWLFQAMREKRGLNYGDYAYVEHFKQVGWSKLEQLNIGRTHQYFAIWIRPVEHANRHFALRQTIFELERFVERGIPDDETFARLQKFLVGHYAGKEQSPMRALGYRLDERLERYERAAFKARVQSLTRDEVNRAIKEHLRGDRLQIVVVTQGAAELKAAIADNVKSPIKYPEKKSDVIVAEDAEIVVKDIGVARDDIAVVSADRLFQGASRAPSGDE